MSAKLFDLAAQKLNETDKAFRISDGIKTACAQIASRR